MPDLKLRLALNESGLGLMLLAAGAGALVVTPFAGLAIARFGGRSLMLGVGLAFNAILPLLTVLPGIIATAIGLAAFGATIAAVDVAMNAQAVVVEQAAGRRMMSGFHGLFSLGGLIGAGGMSIALHFGATPLLATTLVAIAAALLLLSQAPGMLPRIDAPAARMMIPRGRLALIGALCFIGFMAEGAVHDWSAVLLRFERGADAATAGLAYAAFASAMAVGRLTGDALLRHVRAATILRAGAILATAGFLAMALLPALPFILLGCALIGLGLANIVPLLFTAAARTQGMDPGLAISAAATPGYIGLLVGPPMIGFGATLISLPLALAATGLLLLCVAVTARIAEDPHAHPPSHHR